MVHRDDNTQVNFLCELLEWVETWQSMPTKKKLSNEMFFSLRHTLRGLIHLSKYLFETSDLEFILLGKVNSDPIERRFGTYRQLSGANFFVSLKQFFEGEKKLRLRSLIRFDRLSVSDLKKLGESQQQSSQEQTEMDAISLSAFLQEPNSEEISDFSSLHKLESVIFYCSGYVSRSLLRRNKCEACAKLLIKEKFSKCGIRIS